MCGGLLEENFDICQDILARQEDVAIPLKPIYDRLSEMRAQLERLLLTHRWTLRETDLYNFQVSLTEIDKMRVNGKFVDAEGKKPEGQLVSSFNMTHRWLVSDGWKICVRQNETGGNLSVRNVLTCLVVLLYRFCSIY